MKRFLRIAQFGLAMALLLSAWGAFAAEEPRASTRQVLNTAVTTEINNLDPHAPSLIASGQVTTAIYDTLIVRNNDGTYAPCIATAWENIDETTMKFKIRDDVYFHNGEKLTAEDVVYSISRATKEAGSASLMRSFDGEKSYAEDATTAIIKMKRPFAPALAYLSTTRGQIVCRKAIEEMGSKAYGLAPVATGPYIFKEWVVGDHITVERNEKYWGRKPAIKTINFRIIPDSALRSIELEAGGLDVITAVAPQDFERLVEDPRFLTHNVPGFTHEMLQFNMRTTLPTKDIRVRHAMQLALDVPAIVRNVYGDLATPADSIFSSAIWGHIGMGPEARDVKRAKELLAEAGYPDGFEIEITVPENRETLNMLEIAQAMWAEIGVRVTITSYDQATMKERNAAGLTQFGRSNFTASTGDPDHAMANWAIGYKGVFNPNDETLNAKMIEASQELDLEKRRQMYDELQRYCWDTHYSIPLTFPNLTAAHVSSLKGFQMVPSQLYRLADCWFED